MAITINEAIEGLKGSDALVGKPIPERIEKTDNEDIAKKLNNIQRMVVGYLNQANKNIIIFTKHTKQEFRKQDAELLSVSDTVTSAKIGFKGITEKVQRLEYRVRNLSYQKPSSSMLESIKSHKTALIAALLGGVIAAAIPIIDKIVQWFKRKTKDKDQDPKAEKKDQAIPDQPNLRIESSAILIEASTTIEILADQTLCEEAKTILLKADEILLDSPEIIFSNTPIVDKPLSPSTEDESEAESERPGSLAGQLGINDIGRGSRGKPQQGSKLEGLGGGGSDFGGGGGDFGGDGSGATGSWEPSTATRSSFTSTATRDTSTSSTTDTKTEPVDPTAGGSAYLASQRASVMKEIESDPQLKQTITRLLATENWTRGGNARTAVLESMANRILYLRANGQPNLTVKGHVYSGFYGPINTGQLRSVSQADHDATDRAIANVKGGSNVVDLRTDQGMWNAQHREHPYAKQVGEDAARLKQIEGEFYSDWNAGASAWAKQQREKMKAYDEEQAKKKGAADVPAVAKPDQTSAVSKPNVLKEDDTMPVNAQLTAGTTEPSYGPFTVQLSGMAASASEGGVFKPGLLANYAQMAAQKMVEKMPPEKFAKLPPDVKAHVQAALEGRGNFDINFIVRRIAPTMSRSELEQTKKEMAEGGIKIIEPKGYKAPDERAAAPVPDAPKPVEEKKPKVIEPTDKPSATDEPNKPAATEDPNKPATTEDPPKPAATPATPATPDPPPEKQAAEEEVPATTSNPEREGEQANAGSYGGMQSKMDHNSGICII